MFARPHRTAQSVAVATGPIGDPARAGKNSQPVKMEPRLSVSQRQSNSKTGQRMCLLQTLYGNHGAREGETGMQNRTQAQFLVYPVCRRVVLIWHMLS